MMKIDFSTLLNPISENESCGSNIEYELIFDDIRRARESDEAYLPQGEWATELKSADWDKVKNLSIKALSKQSKDLQVASWLVEASMNINNLYGLLLGVNFLINFIDKFWSDLWPKIDEDDTLHRDNIMHRLDRDISTALKSMPMLKSEVSTINYHSKINSHYHSQGEIDNQPEILESISGYKKWEANQNQKEVEELLNKLNDLQIAIEEFELRYSSLKGDEFFVCFKMTKMVIEEMLSWASNLLAKFFQSGCSSSSENFCNNTLVTNNSADDSIMTRSSALNQIIIIADFFRRTEPSSPIPLLLERAVRWGGMSLTQWLEEMLKDDNSLQDINNVLVGMRVD